MNVIISNQNDGIISSLNIDVIKKINGEFQADEIISMFENFFYEKMILDITAIKDYTDLKNIQNLSIHLDTTKLILLLDNSTSNAEYISSIISMGIYNFTKNSEGILTLMKKPNSYRDVASLQNLTDKPNMVRTEINGVKVLGIKNLTEHAGSTSFIYMLKRQLSKNYRVIAVEIDKKDFMYYNDKNMISTTSEDFGQVLLRYSNNVDIILVDLNNSNQVSACTDALYLLEPSTIKVNKLIAKNREIIKSLEGKKVILNKCMINARDIQEFEMEAGIKTFYAIPPINDREPSMIIDNFLVRLGFLKQRVDINDQNNQNNKLFGIFGRKN